MKSDLNKHVKSLNENVSKIRKNMELLEKKGRKMRKIQGLIKMKSRHLKKVWREYERIRLVYLKIEREEEGGFSEEKMKEIINQ